MSNNNKSIRYCSQDNSTKFIYYVTTGIDNIPGSLRDAINQANMLSSSEVISVIINPTVNHIIITAGDIVILSNIKIIGLAQKLIITSNNNSRIFHVNSTVNSTYLEIVSDHGVTILKNNFSESNGGSIYIEPSNHTLILKNVIIKHNNSKLSGGGISTMGKIILYSSVIKSNTADVQGGGIYSNGSVQLYKSRVSHNQITVINESNGGAGIFVDNGDCILNESFVNHNIVAHDDSTGGSGGGIVVMTGSISVQNNSQVNFNFAFNSGGIQEGIGDVTIVNSTVSGNESYNKTQGAAGGGGITITLGTVIVTDSKICDNKTVGMFSGGIVSLIGDVVINHSDICRNINRGPGGGIALNAGSTSIIGSCIRDNVGASLGGGIVCFTPAPDYVFVSNSIISNNILTNAETIKQTIESFLDVINKNLLSTSKQAEKSGGNGSANFINNIPAIILRMSDTSNKLKNLDIIGNNIAGGGIACLLSTAITVISSEIKNNFAGKNVSTSNYPFDADGGGIYGTNVNISSSKINNNKILNRGGGIFAKGSLNVTNSELRENRAKHDNGGGIFNNIKGKALISNTHITNNIAKKGGGVANREQLELISNDIISNKAELTGGGIISDTQFIKINTIIKENSPNDIIVI